MAKRALIIIDLQNDYYPGGLWPLHNIEAVTDNARQVLDYARTTDDLIVHVHHEFLMDPAPFFAPGTAGASIHERMQPEQGETMVLKHQVNSFHETELKNILDQHDIQDIVLVGAMSHMCIDAAARAASDFGYNVTVLEDACASRDMEFQDRTVAAVDVHAAYMSALGFAYATVQKTADWLVEQPAS